MLELQEVLKFFWLEISSGILLQILSSLEKKNITLELKSLEFIMEQLSLQTVCLNWERQLRRTGLS